MRRLFNVTLLVTLGIMAAFTTGCGKKEADITTQAVSLSEETTAALDDLYANQNAYANGTATMNIIPSTTVETVYNDWDAILESNNENAPISLREYVDPDIVYFDYDTDWSIKWDKESGDVMVEQTDIDAREDYKQKQHK